MIMIMTTVMMMKVMMAISMTHRELVRNIIIIT